MPVGLPLELGTYDKEWYAELQKSFYDELLEVGKSYGISSRSCTHATQMLFRAYNKGGVDQISRLINSKVPMDFDTVFAFLRAGHTAAEISEPLVRSAMKGWSATLHFLGRNPNTDPVFRVYVAIRWYEDYLQLVSRALDGDQTLLAMMPRRHCSEDEAIFSLFGDVADGRQDPDKPKSNKASRLKSRVRAMYDVLQVLGWTAALMMPPSAMTM